MNVEEKELAIISSEKCREDRPGKRWWHLRRFITAYAQLLQQFPLAVTTGTAEIIAKVIEQERQNIPALGGLHFRPIGPSFEGVVYLAAAVAKRQIRRVLWFDDPEDLAVDRPENYALLRNCNLAGAYLHVNASAHLWALHASEARGLSGHKYIRTPLNHGPVEQGGIQETVVLIAHDGEKDRISRFVLHYRDVLRHFPRILATSGTLKHIEEFLKIHVPPRERQRLKILPVGATATMAHGPSGGDVIVADEIFDWYREGGRATNLEHVLHHVLFFADNSKSHPHEADIRVLLKTCADPRNRVNLILNSRMAEEWATRYAEPLSAHNGV
jgi:methylglyoxal synthase